MEMQTKTESSYKGQRRKTTEQNVLTRTTASDLRIEVQSSLKGIKFKNVWKKQMLWKKKPQTKEGKKKTAARPERRWKDAIQTQFTSLKANSGNKNQSQLLSRTIDSKQVREELTGAEC